MNAFDYNAPAELFLTRSRSAARADLRYRRFASAAEAIQFFVEDTANALLAGSVMEVGEERFGAKEICQLYVAPEYPLERKAGY
jgi:hypothetical protein